MRQKLTAFLLLAIFIFTSSGAARAQTAGNSDLIALFEQPEAIFVVDVKRTLNQAAPDIFGGDAAALAKLRQTMKSIEDETGIDPYSINKITMAMNLGKGKPENAVVFLQTDAGAAPLVEKMYQNAIAEAELARQINPQLNSLYWLQAQMKVATEISPDSINAVSAHYAATVAKIERIDAKLAALPATANTTATRRALAQAKEKAADFIALTKDATFENDLKTIESLTEKANGISASDAQRAQKIAALEKETAQFKKDAERRLVNANGLDALVNFETADTLNETLLEATEKSLEKLPAAAPRRAQALQKIQKDAATYTAQIEKRWNEVKSPEFETQVQTPTDNDGALLLKPIAVKVSRRDETVGAKKMTVIVTENKFGKLDVSDFDSTGESAVGLWNEKTLVIGQSAAVKAILNEKTISPEKNQALANLINKSNDALAAFAFDLRNVDLSEFNNLAGGESKVWQVYGAINGGASELSLTVNLEKIDAPKNALSANSDEKKTIVALPEANSAATDLLTLVGKAIVGVEGKFTIKFDRRKTASLIEETPRLLGDLLNQAR